MTNEEIGGIGFKDVICFQTRIMMGHQYRYVIKAINKKEILIACLRMGWNDAFRHTSKNIIDKTTGKSVLETKLISNNNFISEKILGDDRLYDTFYNFAKAESTEAKIEAVKSRMSDLKDLFKDYKEVEGEKQVCFGHFQKMFNMAIKLYLCIYMCREYLPFEHEPSDELFDMDIIENIKNADCPIDSIILESLGNSGLKWSKLGTDDANSVDEYKEVQKLIGEQNPGKCKLYYDFAEWNK